MYVDHLVIQNLDFLNFDGIDFPPPITQIQKIEKQNNLFYLQKLVEELVELKC